MNYYNEFDPSAAAWLRELIKQKLIPEGVVDERSITEIDALDLHDYKQCHFFAGIGGWSLALQLAGWPEDRPVWTGSCPCQPFSSAGKGKGTEDERHLWPVFFDLIRKCRPHVVFGEQVESAVGHGWLDGIRADLEGENYALGDCTLGAHSLCAPHIRQRLFWVADSNRLHDDGAGSSTSDDCGEFHRAEGLSGIEDSSRMGLSNHEGPQGHNRHGDDGHQPGRLNPKQSRSIGEAGRLAGGLEHSDVHRCEPRDCATSAAGHGHPAEPTDFWSDSQLILCRDGKHRRIPTEPALFPLADGLPYKLARRGSIRPALLKGAGNAIVPGVAAEFIRAFVESEVAA